MQWKQIQLHPKVKCNCLISLFSWCKQQCIEDTDQLVDFLLCNYLEVASISLMMMNTTIPVLVEGWFVCLFVWSCVILTSWANFMIELGQTLFFSLSIMARPISVMVCPNFGPPFYVAHTLQLASLDMVVVVLSAPW